MPDILLADLERSMKGWATELLASAKAVTPVDAKVDGQPAKADLVNAGQDTVVAADPMDLEARRTAGLVGLIESGDNLKLLNFQLGPITSSLIGITVGTVGSMAINIWFPAWRNPDGTLTNVKPVDAEGKLLAGAGINFVNPLVNAVGIAGSATFLPPFIGRSGAYFISGILLFNLALTYTPLSTWITNIVNAIAKPPTTTAQSQRTRSGQPARPRQAPLQAPSSNGHSRVSSVYN